MIDPSRLPLDDKVLLASGGDFWRTKAVDDIPPVLMSDGPHGLRKQNTSADHLGINASVPATCFPPASGLSQSWDPDLTARVGAALGRECRAEGVHVLLGPAMNIKRSPLGGRNLEYFSEDPFLTGVLATGWVNGIQDEGVGASPKHFAVNNQETDRQRVSSDLDERTLREIYLRAFQRVIQEAKPWTVMSSYNRVNGVPVSDNHFLLTEILRDEWGFDGVVVSDWAAVSERVASARAGLDLEMPYSGPRNDRALATAVREGFLPEEVVERIARRVADLAGKSNATLPVDSFDVSAHHELAREAAARSIVLLKNEDNLLPLAPDVSLAVIGEFAIMPRYQGGGSSQVNATIVDIPLKEICRIAGENSVSYARGFATDKSEDADHLIREATTLASSAEVAILFLGLPDSAESEGWDRSDLELPEDQIKLARSVFDANPNTIAVFAHGGVVRLEPIAYLPAMLGGALLGQGVGHAVADVLFGLVNPSGRLSESIPARIEDTPAFLNFPGEHGHVLYGEGLFVGYRWFDARKLPVTFPFGHGLSYTSFLYSDLTLSADDQGIIAAVTVTNSGERAGREVPQLYVSVPDSAVVRPPLELKGFANVLLESGENTRVSVRLQRKDLAYWDTRLRQWIVETGEYTVAVGSSSRDIRLSTSVEVIGDEVVIPLTPQSTLDEILANPAGADIIARAMTLMRSSASGQDVPAIKSTELSGLKELQMMGSFPIERMLNLTGGTFTPEMLTKALDAANGAVDSGRTSVTEQTEGALLRTE